MPAGMWAVSYGSLIHARARRPDLRHRFRHDLRSGLRRQGSDDRGGGSHPCHVGRGARHRRDRGTSHSLRGGRLCRRPGAAHALRRPRRRPPRLQGAGVAGPGGRPADQGLARAGGERHGRAHRRQGAAAAGGRPDAVPGRSAGRPRPPPRRRAARSRRAGAQHFPHLLPRPAHGHLRRFRRRQVRAAVDARAQCRCRRLGDRPDRRARPRGAGVPAGRSRRGGARSARWWWSRPPTSRR
jgi:hypothetical protein